MLSMVNNSQSDAKKQLFYQRAEKVGNSKAKIAAMQKRQYP
jgi:hypothetical protein